MVRGSATTEEANEPQRFLASTSSGKVRRGVSDQLGEEASEILAVDDPVKESVLQEKLAGLEPRR